MDWCLGERKVSQGVKLKWDGSDDCDDVAKRSPREICEHCEKKIDFASEPVHIRSADWRGACCSQECWRKWLEDYEASYRRRRSLTE